MPMPPNVNPYDPRKSRLEQPGQQQQQPQQQAQPAAPVQSSLPAMQQPQQQQPQVAQAGQPQQTAQVEKKKPAAPITYQQQAGAVADPRFSQALAQKLQQDVAAKQAALQQQQAEFQQKLTEAGSGVAGAPTRINEILGKVKAGTATDAELAEFQSLQQAQYQGPTGLDGAANIAALSQLAASPALLAQQYAGFAPGGVSAGDFQRAMAGLQKSPQLAAAQEAATGLAQQATSAEEVATQQAALLKGQTEATKEAAETGSKAAEAEYTGQLSEAQKAETQAKTEALKRLKEGLFFSGKKIKQSDLDTLGLTQDQLKNLKSLNVGDVEGFEGVTDITELNKKIENLKTKQTEEGSSSLTPEQQRLLTVYKEFTDFDRDIDKSSQYGYAKKEDLAKINALRRIRGQAPLTPEEVELIGKGKESGRVSGETLSGMIGRLTEGEKAYTEEANLTIPKKQERLTGDKWYKGGLVKADTDLTNLDPASNTKNIYNIARKMFDQMQSTGAKENSLYKWLKDNVAKINTGTKGAAKGKWDPAQMAQEFKNLVKQNKDSYTRSIEGRSTISRDLSFE